MTVPQIAQQLHVDNATVRKWIVQGCPCIHRGSRGPGNGAVLDLADVEAWRGATNSIPRRNGVTPDDILQQIATALWEAVEHDHADIRAGISKADAAALLIVAWERCCKSFGLSFKWDQQPEPIRALMRVI